MKEIFKNIEDREWDWFGYSEDKVKALDWILNGDLASLADLLANKSWCIVVWGEEYGYFAASNNGSYKWIGKLDLHSFKKYKTCSEKTFQILQQEGEEEAIEYIKKTMI